MKKHLSFLSLLVILLACNQAGTPPVDEPSLPVPKNDSSAVKPATDTVAKNDTSFTVSLTKEELKDDSVFADGSVPTSWENAGFTDVKGFKLFLKKVQLLVADNDKGKLAKLVSYPLNKTIRNEADFIKNYDQVFTKDARMSVALINFSQVFRNDKGAMTEGGKVWFSQQGTDFKIIAING